LSGGGSSGVIPVGGIAVPDLGPRDFPGPLIYDPSSPVRAIEAFSGGARVEYVEGNDVQRAVQSAQGADAVIVFAHQWTAERYDAPSLVLPDNQDRLITEVARTHQRTVVVLETGGPVCMPWLSLVAAVVQAWYPGARGGEAIARTLFGEVNPCGRLPITFPQDESQLPRTTIKARAASARHLSILKRIGLSRLLLGFNDGPPEVDYFEGADAGYKWFDKNEIKPLFPFGFGLSYSLFDYMDLTATSFGSSATLSLNVRNKGARRGADVPQFYVRYLNDPTFPIRLVGWRRVLLDPDETQLITLKVDPRLLARFNKSQWEIAAGRYLVQAGANAGELSLSTEFTLTAAQLRP
jgi:beta-glucosidase